MAYVSMKQMLETGVHFGHQTRRWNPKMRPYIFGARNGVHIIDLQQTVKLFQTAHDAIVKTVANGGKILFIGTKRQAQETVEKEASRGGQYYVTNRWMGGTLTNFATIRQSIERLKKIEEMFESGTIKRFTKKEALRFSREAEKLNAVLGGIKEMEKLPEMAFIVDPKREDIAVRECLKLHIPIAAITDTNCDPDVVDYIIPGNDDAIRAIKLFVSHIADACLEGAAQRKDDVEAAMAAKADEGSEADVPPAAPTPELQTPAQSAEKSATDPAPATTQPEQTPPVVETSAQPGAHAVVDEEKPGAAEVPAPEAAPAAQPESNEENA